MLVDELVFSMDGEQYRWRDVLVAAVRWGAWRDLEQAAREGAACVRQSEATGNDLPAGALDNARREFRSARDLVTGQVMQNWLQRWEISAQEWSTHLRRELQRARRATGTSTLVERFPIAPDEAARLTFVDAICSGRLERWAQMLAGRAAVAAQMRIAGKPAAPRPDDLSRKLDVGLEAPDVAALGGIVGSDEAQLRGALDRLGPIEQSLEQFRLSHVAERIPQEYVGTRQIDWVRLDCGVMAFPDGGLTERSLREFALRIGMDVEPDLVLKLVDLGILVDSNPKPA